MHHYRHTQVGWLLVALFALVALVVVPPAAGFAPVLAVAGLIVLVIPLLFGTLTVAIDATHVGLRFGIGLFRKRYALADIRTYRIVRNPWYYGWGIKRIPGGWLYNVSGLSAVELRLRGDRVVRIGTDEPDALQAALVGALGPPPPLTGDDLATDRRRMRRALLVGAAIAVGVLVPVGWLMVAQARPPVAEVSPEAFVVRSGLYDARIPIVEMTSVSLEPRLPNILIRTNGYALGATLRGHFRLEILGSGQLYIQRDRPPFLLVRTPETFVAVGFAEPERTRALYAVLAGAFEQRRAGDPVPE
jgi:hypothetical protein